MNNRVNKIKSFTSPIVCTFAILPDQTHLPIAKEHTIQPNFAVSGNSTSLPKKMFLVFHSKPFYQTDNHAFFCPICNIASKNMRGFGGLLTKYYIR
jgi:hypothetical protein